MIATGVKPRPPPEMSNEEIAAMHWTDGGETGLRMNHVMRKQRTRAGFSEFSHENSGRIPGA